jgi:hypothetical protein
MRTWILLLVAAVMALSAAGAGAYPTFSGPTGMVALPNAEVAPPGALILALDYQNQSGDVTLWPARAVYGIADKTEVWAGYMRASASSDSTSSWNVGAKYKFATEPVQKISLAVGGSWGKGDALSEDVTITNLFVVASKNIASRKAAEARISAKASLGMLWENVGSPIDQTLTEPFLGLELYGKKGVSLALDYRVKNSDFDAKAPFSAVVRMPLSQTRPLWAEAGFSNAAFMGLGGDSSSFFLGLGYRLAIPQAGGEGTSGTRTRPWGY